MLVKTQSTASPIVYGQKSVPEGTKEQHTQITQVPSSPHQPLQQHTAGDNVCQDVVTSFDHNLHNLRLVPSCKRHCVYVQTTEETRPLTQVSLQTH